MPRARKAPPPLDPDALRLAVLPLINTVIYPQVGISLYVTREPSARAVEEATNRNIPLLVVAQRDPGKEDVGPDDLYAMGTEATIGRVLKLPDGHSNVLVQGVRRMRILGYEQILPFLIARVEPIEEDNDKPLTTEALMRAVLALFEKCVKASKTLPEDHYIAAMNVEEPGRLADLVASSLDLSMAQRQDLLETLSPAERLQKISIHLSRELELLDLQNRIHSQVQQEVDKSQREFFLREQMKAIQKELGETDSFTKDLSELRERFDSLKLPDEVREKAEVELRRLSAMPAASPEVGIIRTYIDWLLALPWTVSTDDNIDIKRAAKVLDEQHYGLPKAKERILEYMAVRQLSQSTRSPILCFVGPPGVGKTSLGRSIAQALGRKFVRISLGGVHDEAEIRGHRRTYIGALPGRIIQTMRQAETINPVFMLDEIDKLGSDFRGDPSSALLEVLDPEQNHAFADHYLDVSYDLTKVMFVCTANMLDPVPAALRDRLEVIELSGYIEDEKLHIAEQFLVPRQRTDHGLGEKVRFTPAALRHIVREYTHEAGVRNLEREIATVCRKVARSVAEGRKGISIIGHQAVERYLGPPRFAFGLAEEQDEVGVATGVAVTTAGGDLIAVEIALLPGKGTVTLTGQLGEVMRESAQAALSYARSRANELGLDDKFHESLDVHIHIPAGAVPKDGPSAGITMATALISALTRRPVYRHVAMTGEITLRGQVLAIGGLKEKVLAAHRAGLKTFLAPSKNRKDLPDVPRDVQRDVRIIFVDHMDKVLPLALGEHIGLKVVKG
ncbi:MAG: lon [Chloroflexi bacterium]|nr:lon [Chloroflexota bacterium]